MSQKKKKKSRSGKFKLGLTKLISRFYEKNQEKPIHHKEVYAALSIKDRELRKQVFDILKEMSRDGFLMETGNGYFQYNNQSEQVEGEIQLTGRGVGFLLSEDKAEQDIYIAPSNTGQAMNGDWVRVVITKKGGRRVEGKVVDILRRDKSQFVGIIDLHPKFAFFIPDNQRSGVDIYIPIEKLKGARNQDRVLAQITAWPSNSKNPYGEVVEVLTSKSQNDNEMLSILCNQGIDPVFPQDVIASAEKVGIELDPKEIKKRRDFRDITTFTIDPLDAKDFDDALSIEKLENGNYEIGVHIADVSHYVVPGSPMDQEASKRGNSVYLVDRVIPMLPEQLSNLACSLRPHEDKYTFSAVFEMDEKGKVYQEWFGKAVIHSDRRFTYEEAQEIIEGKKGDFEKEIRLMDSIAKILRKKRLKKGALSIESEELRFRLDKDGNPEGVVTKVSKDANKLIEEFMLLANKKVAQFMHRASVKKDNFPFVYRCHDKPDIAKIELLRVFIDKFGHRIEFSNPDQIAQAINQLLTDLRLKNEYSIIQSMVIRSMAKASYETENIGHYGLAFSHYTHFTSPIRRYADLVVHRILFEELSGQKHRYHNELNGICKHISRMERKAIEAERESSKYFQVLFMEEKLGMVFQGTVSGLAEFGLFVKIADTGCEGMIAMNEIPGDRFYFDQDKFRIIGSRSKKEYNFGDEVEIQVISVDMRKRQINLELV
ncbi:MAG: ribonuclease R [Bacteroidetes bacterium]|nr:MAG: ribonuclease R [Bacteroidota bacterium]